MASNTRQVAAWAAAVVLCSSVSVRAQTSSKAAAEALFDEAQALAKQGNYAEACKRYEGSYRIDPGIGTILYLADCYERIGRYASAWAFFRDGASQARAAGQNDRAAAGERRAELLEPRLSKLTVKVDPENQNVAEIMITRGDEPVPRAVWGVAVPVDGGSYEIKAVAPGYRTWAQTVSVPNEKSSAAVVVPKLEPAPESAPAETPPPVAPPPAAPAPPPEPPVAPTPPPEADSSQRTWGYVLGGVGLVGLGVGSYFGLRAINKNSDAEELCPRGDLCDDPAGVELTDDAKRAATLSNVSFGLGAAALAGGIVLILTAPSEEGAQLSLAPEVGTARAGVSLGGRF